MTWQDNYAWCQRIYILDVWEASYCCLVLYINTEIHIKIKASVAPPTMPNMIARWLCTLCFFWGTTVTCGASIGGLNDASSHDVVEKVRHKLPDVLQNDQGIN